MIFERRFLVWPLLVAIGIIVCWIVWLPNPAATWIKVEAPEQAVTGAVFPIRIRLTSDRSELAAQPMFLGVHLHGLTSRHRWHGSVTSAPPQVVEASNGVFEFNPVIPENKTSGFVFLLVSVSPTGRWEDRIAAVRSDDIPVFANATKDTGDRLQPLPAYERDEKPTRARRDAMPIRLVLALGWLTCGWLFWRARETREPLSGRRILFPALAVLAAIWELSPLEQTLGEQARAFATAHEWYEMRRGPQKILTVTFTLGVATTVLILIRRRGGFVRQVPLIGFALHVGVTLVGFLSLHRIDAILGRSLFSVPLVQVFQLGALLLALIGAIVVSRQAPLDPRPKG